jgi:3',5'-cyclic AMP phosphodiesterase CpdA
MLRIAHVSDLHLLEEGHESRRGVARRRLFYLTLLRPNDAAERKRRALAALSAARASGADHVVVSGDLTEDGLDRQFEIAAEVLAESGLSPSRVTLLPGNHDAYVDADAFTRALRGPLAAFAETSAEGVPLALREAVILPMTTAVRQRYTRSAGFLTAEALAGATRLAEATARSGRALVLAMHHAPQPRSAAMQWIDGLAQHAAVGQVLERHDHVHVLHGHVHAAEDRGVRPGATPRIFSTEAVVDGRTPLRVYEVRHGRLSPAPSATHIVSALALA